MRPAPFVVGELDGERRRVYEKLASTHSGRFPGAFIPWLLRDPELADRAHDFHNVFRLKGTFPKRLYELTILIVARHFMSQFLWTNHEHLAEKAGLPGPVIEALRVGETPVYPQEDEAVVSAIAHELLSKREITPENFERGMSSLGYDSLVELITTIGFYSTAALLVMVFEVPVPGAVPGAAGPLPAVPDQEDLKVKNGSSE